MAYCMEKNLLSFVIPCYRSENTIKDVYEEIVNAVSQRPEYDYEIIAINDCSPDGVLSRLKEIAEADQKFKVIDLAKNFGKHGAMMAGLSRVKGEYIINLDDDYQCPVYELWNLLDPIINGGYDCATAHYEKKQEAKWKRLGSKANAGMVRMMLEQPKEIELENFLAFKRFVCDELLRYGNPYPFLAGLILRTTHRIKLVPMKERERGDGAPTGFTFKKSFSLMVNGLTSFSVKPLRVATVSGFFFAVLGFLYGIFIIIRKLLYPSILVGYSSIMSIQLFCSGILMLILGMTGEYIGRIYISLNNAPQYVIREEINTDQKCGEIN